MAVFTDVFDDVTKLGRKIPTSEYLPEGKYPIVDQGQQLIAGYTNESIGLFSDVPVIIFGDHTRIVKYIDEPCFLGADGVKLLKAKDSEANYKYLYYVLSNARIPNTGYNRHFKWLKEVEIPSYSAEEQAHIVNILDKVSELIDLRKRQLEKLDELVKSRFVEMFGEPISNSKNLPAKKLGDICDLKAGDFTPADDIHDIQTDDYPFPCFGGNGVRGYVDNYTQDGEYPIIGRQGALCGNVQYASGKFRNTEHAVLVTPKMNINKIWLFELLLLEDLFRFHTGAAQPGLAVKTLNTVDTPVADIELQNAYAEFYVQIGKSKAVVQQSLYKLETLKKSLMQGYFG